MIRSIIFDLDGVLVQTEKLKAISYARAAAELGPGEVGEDDVVEAFRQLAGRPRQEVATALLRRFGLEKAARRRMKDLGVGTPWQAYVQVRLPIYDSMLSDAGLVRSNVTEPAVTAVRQARRDGYKVGLATMSSCSAAGKILEIVGLGDAFDFVGSQDDVEHGKPSPEIYLLVAGELEVRPQECLVIEDSPAGIQSAQAAGMEVIGVSTPFMGQQLRQSALLPDDHVADQPSRLPDIVAQVIARHNRGASHRHDHEDAAEDRSPQRDEHAVTRQRR